MSCRTPTWPAGPARLASESTVLAHRWPGPGGGPGLADQQRGAVPVPEDGELVLVKVIRGAVDRQGGICQLFHVPQRGGGLAGPAPGAFGSSVVTACSSRSVCALRRGAGHRA